MDEVFQWLCDRKHEVVYASVNKDTFEKNKSALPVELWNVWRFLGFHVVLATQRYCSKAYTGVKGHTIFVFDNEEHERLRFPDLVMRPPAWSDEYYCRDVRLEALDEIVDVPFFGDSKEIGLIQVADVAAFCLRRYAELKETSSRPKFDGEEDRLSGWLKKFISLSIGRSHIYKRVGRCTAESYFFDNAAQSIRDI